MTLLHNSYIFLRKDKKEDISAQPKDADGAVHYKAGKSVFSYIKSIFGEPVRKDTENMVLKIIYTYEIEFEGIKHDVEFTLYNVTGYTYLDLCVSAKTTKQAVNVLEYIQEKISSSDIEKQYIMIISYDAISEYYCNKAYPKLNKLERNLRKLLFNTYTVNFGVDYYQKTISPDLQNKINGVIKAKGNEEKKQIERLKKFFYSMEFSDIQALLFTKKWTRMEEESKSEFLLKNEKLSELSEEELRKAFDRFSPQSDWERLFADKIDHCEIEKLIEIVRSMRNDIAHCKFFYKEQYLTFNETVGILNRSIIKAIKLTEEKDFAEKQVESFRVALADIANSITEFEKRMKETILNTVNNVVQSFATSMDQWRKSFLNIDFSELEMENDEEAEGENDQWEGDGESPAE